MGGVVSPMEELEGLPTGWANCAITPKSNRSVCRYLRIASNEIELGKKLGEGSFGVVYEGVWTKPSGGSLHVAVKTLKCTLKQNDPEVQDFMRELSLVSQLSHPNIVAMLGASVALDGSSMMVTELVNRGNLFQLIHIQRRKMKNDWVIKFCMQIASGMSYLHSKQEIHR